MGEMKPPEGFSFPWGEAFKSSGIIPENPHFGEFTKEEGRALVGLPSFNILWAMRTKVHETAILAEIPKT